MNSNKEIEDFKRWLKDEARDIPKITKKIKHLYFEAMTKLSADNVDSNIIQEYMDKVQELKRRNSV